MPSRQNDLRSSSGTFAHTIGRTEKTGRVLAVSVTALAIAFAMIRAAVLGEPYTVRCLIGLLLTPSILVAEWLFRFRLRLPVFVLLQCFYLLAVIGKCFHLFDISVWWDIAMHGMGGFCLAVSGLVLFDLFEKRILKRPPAQTGKRAPAHCIAPALFALCFAVTAGVLWELYEFTVDRLFGWDMQMDTIVSRIDSSLLGDGMGSITQIGNISETAVNGVSLPIKGYLDIGLYDTMEDLALLTAGALAAGLIRVLFRQEKLFFHLDSDPIQSQTAEHKS